MSFNKFKETNENNNTIDNKESSIEDNKKHRNQILEIGDEYNDNFNEKMDSVNNKKETNDTPKKQDVFGSEKSRSLFGRLKDFISKEKLDKAKVQETTETADKSPQKNAHDKFVDSLKPTMTEEETKKYNAEHGYSGTTERPKGGFQRERVLPGSSYSRHFEDDSYDNTKNNKNA